MFWKSLQLKLILIFFVLIATTIIIIGVYSISRTEEVYYDGFVEEMLNTISSFGIKVENIREENIVNNDEKNNENIVTEENITQEMLSKIYNNFTIYFSLNNISRHGLLLDSNYKELLTSQKLDLTEAEIECAEKAQMNYNHYYTIRDLNSNKYIFAYYINQNFENENIEFIILVEQNRNYISEQLTKIQNVYLIAIVAILIITICIVYITARSITKPISILTNKAESIANGSIEHIALSPKTHAGYEISKLVESFNLMISQIKDNMNEISREKNKLETILLHLADGVLHLI